MKRELVILTFALLLITLTSLILAESERPVPTLYGAGTNDNAGRANTACPMDAKLCKDGSSVGRTGPNCEFAPCPYTCVCPSGYKAEGNVCNPECYSNEPPCLSPSIACTEDWGNELDDRDKGIIVGNSCGTVSPGYNNECCVNKGYEGWDEENFTCIGEASIKEIERYRLGAERENNGKECPENCVCSGSTVKCEFDDGRTMTVYAGNSGNVIVQIKNLNMSTNVTLYKEDGKVYGVFKGNDTREIHLPDEVKDQLQNHTRTRLYNESINLTDEGYYKIDGKKKSRLFWLFPVREHVRADMNASTGQPIKIRNPWWGFLARDVREKGNSTIN